MHMQSDDGGGAVPNEPVAHPADAVYEPSGGMSTAEYSEVDPVVLARAAIIKAHEVQSVISSEAAEHVAVSQPVSQQAQSEVMKSTVMIVPQGVGDIASSAESPAKRYSKHTGHSDPRWRRRRTGAAHRSPHPPQVATPPPPELVEKYMQGPTWAFVGFTFLMCLALPPVGALMAIFATGSALKYRQWGKGFFACVVSVFLGFLSVLGWYTVLTSVRPLTQKYSNELSPVVVVDTSTGVIAKFRGKLPDALTLKRNEQGVRVYADEGEKRGLQALFYGAVAGTKSGVLQNLGVDENGYKAALTDGTHSVNQSEVKQAVAALSQVIEGAELQVAPLQYYREVNNAPMYVADIFGMVNGRKMHGRFIVIVGSKMVYNGALLATESNWYDNTKVWDEVLQSLSVDQ